MYITRTILCMALATTVACKASDDTDDTTDTKARHDFIRRYTEAQDALHTNALLYASDWGDAQVPGEHHRKFRTFWNKATKECNSNFEQLEKLRDKAKQAYTSYRFTWLNNELDEILPTLPTVINGIITAYYQESPPVSTDTSAFKTPLRRFDVTIPELKYAHIHMNMLYERYKCLEIGLDETVGYIRILPSETAQPIMKELEEQITSFNNNAAYWQKQIDNLPPKHRAKVEKIRQIQQKLPQLQRNERKQT